MKTGVILIAMQSVVASCAPTASPSGAITIDYTVVDWGTTAHVRVQPDGRVDQSGSTYRGDSDVGIVVTDYRRFAALVEPMRRYAGKTMPCGDHIPDAAEIARNPLAATGKPTMATLRWEATGEAVTFNLVCRHAPPALAQFRDALDLLKRATPDANAAPLDPGNADYANLIERSN